MPISKARVRRQLLQKFGFEEVRGSRHEAIAFFYDGQKVATTRFSRGSRREIDDDLLKVMAREVRVSNLSFFKGMIDCPKSLDDYIEKLKQGGYI